MNGYFAEAGSFLISVAFSFYILMVMLRFLLQSVRADFYNPLSQFVVQITSPALKPFRRVIPGLAGIDMAAVVLLLLLQIVELVLISLIAGGSLHLGVLIIVSGAKLLSLAVYIFIIAIIVQAVLSWIQPASYNPFTVVLYQLTSPILRPIRNLIPTFSGIDLSPLVALVVLNLIVLAIPHVERSLLQLVLG
jgi:YggT family protein